jgi:DNA polymerase elongation subunit (family B)
MAEPKVLVLDIETALMEVYTFDIKDQYIKHSQIKKDWHVMAWAAKWLGDPPTKAHYRDQRNSKVLSDDKAILKDLWHLMSQADYVMTQNGKRFDIPRLTARFMLNGMDPAKYLKHIDLFVELKHVGFTSHSLEYLTGKFCTKFKKLSHKKFPGMSLWIECAKGNQKAWDEMKTYNIHDVLATEELYEKTKKFMPKVVYELSNPRPVCVRCGGRSFLSNGKRNGVKSSYTRLNCRACGEAIKWQPETARHCATNKGR